MRISDWSSDVCSSDLRCRAALKYTAWALGIGQAIALAARKTEILELGFRCVQNRTAPGNDKWTELGSRLEREFGFGVLVAFPANNARVVDPEIAGIDDKSAHALFEQELIDLRLDEHTTELQSQMRISYAIL